MKNILLATASVAALAFSASVAMADVNSDNGNVNSNLTNTTQTTNTNNANQANSNSVGDNNKLEAFSGNSAGNNSLTNVLSGNSAGNNDKTNVLSYNSAGDNNKTNVLSGNSLLSGNKSVDLHDTTELDSGNLVKDSNNHVSPVATTDNIDIDTGRHSDSNVASFSDNTNVTASVLGATIASSNVNFHPDHGSRYEGNEIGAQAFSGVTGVATANQNTGINANTQQSISLSVGNVGIGAAVVTGGGTNPIGG